LESFCLEMAAESQACLSAKNAVRYDVAVFGFQCASDDQMAEDNTPAIDLSK